MKTRKTDGTPTDGHYIAACKGQCGHCHGVIEAGQPFWWRGSVPAETECEACRQKR